MSDIKWIKICTDIFDDEKILLIEGMPEADSIIVIWFKLLCLAGKQNNSGVFMLNDRIPYTDKMLATIFRRKESTVTMALRTFEDFGMIEIVDGAITIPKWGKHQSLDKIEKTNERQREYMREYRKKQKLLACGAALDDGECKTNGNANCNTNGNTNVSCAEEEKEKEKDSEGEKKKKRKSSPSVTDEIATELMEPMNISDPVKEKVHMWLQYKSEIGDTYKTTGFKTLLKQIEKVEQEHGSIAVMNQIDKAMRSSWHGMYLETIGTDTKYGNNKQQRVDPLVQAMQEMREDGEL
jgi:predicted phage replisome organizer